MTLNHAEYSSPSSRIDTLDVIRGFAVLGILLMNVQSFSMPDAAYFNPLSYGEFSGANFIAWMVGELFVSGKFSALFAMLFGAGVVLFSGSEQAGKNKPANLHYRRMLWLLVFGLLHFYLLWWGDVLFTYALAGMLVFPFRRLSASALVGCGVLFLIAAAVIEVDLFAQFSDPAGSFQYFRDTWMPSPRFVAEEIALFQSASWSELLTIRHDYMTIVIGDEGPAFGNALSVVARPAGLMLVGMALLKGGWLSDSRPLSARRWLAWWGTGAGLALTLLLLGVNLHLGFPPEFNFLWGAVLNFGAAPILAVGYIGVLTILIGQNRLPKIRARLSAAGRLAFTNYVAQSVICGWLFYSYGLGWFGQVSRIEQLAIACAVIGFQLWLSPWMLRYLNQGPLEWLWRCLTYGRRFPLWRKSLHS